MSQAVRKSGFTKDVIRHAIDDDDLNATKNEKNRCLIEDGELRRWAAKRTLKKAQEEDDRTRLAAMTAEERQAENASVSNAPEAEVIPQSSPLPRKRPIVTMDSVINVKVPADVSPRDLLQAAPKQPKAADTELTQCGGQTLLNGPSREDFTPHRRRSFTAGIMPQKICNLCIMGASIASCAFRAAMSKQEYSGSKLTCLW